jgi:membrane fusion protein
MEQGLFRRESIAARADQAFGAPLLNSPPSFALAVVGACLLLAATAALFWWGGYDRKETVRGFLAPDAGLVRVVAPVSGVLRELAAREGQVVRRGEVLAVITAARSTRAVRDVDSSITAHLDARAAGLRAQRDEERLGLQLELVRNEAAGAAARRELATLQARLAIERERAYLTERRLADLASMVALGLVPRMQYEQVNDEYLTRRAAALDLERSVAGKQDEIARLNHDRGLQESRANARVAEFEARLAALAQERTESAARAESTIRAPLDGVLTALEVTRGQQVATGSGLFVIVPVEAKLQARLLVPTRAAGFMVHDQPVRLRFEAFPYQRFGTGAGVISEVPTAVLSAGEMVGPLRATEPVYVVEVDLTSASIAAYGKAWPLKPGMLLDADVRLARQRLVELLLDPLRSVQGRI